MKVSKELSCSLLPLGEGSGMRVLADVSPLPNPLPKGEGEQEQRQTEKFVGHRKTESVR
jgi:hypothetical protein